MHGRSRSRAGQLLSWGSSRCGCDGRNAAAAAAVAAVLLLAPCHLYK